MRKIKLKRGQEAIGMSFSMIFSIILIAVFIAAAFIGIRALISWQKNVQVGLFIQGLQNEVDTAWNAPESSTVYKAFLPTGIEYICFMNLTADVVASNNVETNIFNEIKKGVRVNYNHNFYIYAPTKTFKIKTQEIKHIDLRKHNPVCIKVIKNQASVKVNKSFDNPLVEVSG